MLFGGSETIFDAHEKECFCKKVGVYIFPNQIRTSEPTLVAIGENINLTNFCHVSNALKVLKP